jgi:ketosteroid isomerase-like protein
VTTPTFDTAEHAEEAFYEAMRTGDSAALTSVWASEEEVVCIHPHGPRLVGFEPVSKSWEAILDQGPIEVQVSQQHCTVSDALAIHNLIEEITIRSDRNSETVFCYATNVYALTTDGWRMILHQAAPAEEVPEQHIRTNEVLH